MATSTVTTAAGVNSSIVFQTRGIATASWVFTTATGASTSLSLGNYSQLYARFAGPSGGTSSLTIEGAYDDSPSGPWQTLSTVTGLALTLTDAEPAVIYEVEENLPYVRARASTATEAGLTVSLVVKYLENVAG